MANSPQLGRVLVLVTEKQIDLGKMELMLDELGKRVYPELETDPVGEEGRRSRVFRNDVGQDVEA